MGFAVPRDLILYRLDCNIGKVPVMGIMHMRVSAYQSCPNGSPFSPTGPTTDRTFANGFAPWHWAGGVPVVGFNCVEALLWEPLVLSFVRF